MQKKELTDYFQGLAADFDFTELARAYDAAEKLHGPVTYGADLSMLDQVLRTAELTANAHPPCPDITIAALLHKCMEAKRIDPSVQPYTTDQLRQEFNANITSIVLEVASEPPESKDKSKIKIWQDKALWASQLSPEAQQILLAEKIANFETSRDKPNPKKPLSWHEEYMHTRMLLVEACKPASDVLYNQAQKTSNEALAAIRNSARSKPNLDAE